MAAIAAASSISLDGFYHSTSSAVSSRYINSTIDWRRADITNISHRCRVLLFGATHFHWMSTGHDLCFSKVYVAADYSDSVPDSSNYMGKRGYHPLEELKVCRRIRDTKLTCPEIARTTVEANCSALLVFPGAVHSEPHEQISWAEYQYVIDDYGDIYVECFDNENILQDRGASNPVQALFGIDIPTYEERRTFGGYSIPASYSSDDVSLDDNYFDVIDYELPDNLVDWGMPDDSRWIHPTYFTKCLTKAVNTDFGRGMDHPKNGVSIVGCLRPAFIDEEPYLRRLFHNEESDSYNADRKDGDVRFNSNIEGNIIGSILYRLEIMKIELFSVYGVQSTISLQDFQDAEPDVLIYSSPAILERFAENGTRCNVALKALCKKKGIPFDRANLIGVDSLGIDVRISSGAEVQTHRFPFKVRATSEATAEKQIQQLLFPRSQRKKSKIHSDGLTDSI